MRKVHILLLLLLSLLIVACEDNRPLETLDVVIVSESYTYDDLKVDVVVNLDDLSEKELTEISNSIASQMYIKYASEIHDSHAFLTVNLYKSSTSVENATIDYGKAVYEVNISLEKPGLSKGIFTLPSIE